MQILFRLENELFTSFTFCFRMLASIFSAVSNTALFSQKIGTKQKNNIQYGLWDFRNEYVKINILSFFMFILVKLKDFEMLLPYKYKVRQLHDLETVLQSYHFEAAWA